jgi:hypothetical protein
MHKPEKILLAVMIAALPTIGIAAESKAKHIDVESWSFGNGSATKGGGQNQIQSNDTAGGETKSKNAPDDVSPKQKKQRLPAVQKVREAAQPGNEKK